MSNKIQPIRVSDNIMEFMEGQPEEAQLQFQLQLASIRIANALTALAIKNGAMTPEGEFIFPEEESKEGIESKE